MALMLRPFVLGPPVDGGPPALVQLALPLLAPPLARLAGEGRIVAQGLGFEERRQVLVQPGPQLVAKLLVLGCEGKIHGGRVADHACTLTLASGNGDGAALTEGRRAGEAVDFTYDDEQLALQDVARTALERECGPDLLRQLVEDPAGITPALWSTLVDLGWTGLLVPEEHGGTGGAGLLEMCIVLEQMGRIPLPGPFFSSAVAATLAARALGATELLGDLASGTRRGTVALGELGHGEPLGTVRTRARRKAARWVLTGEKAAVVDGHTRGLGHRGGPQRGGRAVLPARGARRRAGPLARPDPQAGPAGARRHPGRAARAAGEPGRLVAARPGRHRRRPGGRDGGCSRPRPGRGHRLHLGAGRLRQAGGHLPDRAPPPGRDVPAGRDGPGRRSSSPPGPRTPTRPSAPSRRPWRPATRPRPGCA